MLHDGFCSPGDHEGNQFNQLAI